jgi:phosphate-selective porin OprO/OprP
MTRLARHLLFTFSILACIGTASAQNIESPIPYFGFGRGIGITAPDSMYNINIRFRIQNRIGVSTFDQENLMIDEWEMTVRRLRLRFDGYVYSPKVTYVLQLSFTRADMDWDNTQFPNIVRDAMVMYRINPHWAIGIGQGKLPGNRQRITSSGDMQFVDRSAVNALFNFDRDFGVNVFYTNNIKQFHYAVRGTISSGDGRNVAATDPGLGYSGRVEFYPLGQFTNGGDYFEGDLVREKKPKLSIAGFYFYNEASRRTGGTIGQFLYEPRTFVANGIDAMFKYMGWSYAAEFMNRSAANPLTFNEVGDVRYLYTGYGLNNELSYIFRNMFQLAGRYTFIEPRGIINQHEKSRRYYTVGASRYIKGHRLKIQTDVTLHDFINAPQMGFYQARFQVEIGI